MLLYRWLNEAVELRGTAKALVYRDTYLSWRGMQHRVERRAQELASMGIEKGHWVGLMLGNVPDFAILALALSRLGAVVVPLDPTTGVRDLTLFLEHAPLRALVTRPRGGNELPSSQTLVVRTRKETRLEPESRRRLQGTLLTCSIYKQVDPPNGNAEVVLLTADTSGDPKGVLRTSENLDANCENLAASLDVNETAKILLTMPLYSAYGFDLGLCLALRYGATLFLEDEMSAKRIAKLLREQEIDFLPATAPIFAALSKMPTARPLKTRFARFLATGSKLPQQIADEFRQRYGIRTLPIYHTTEAGAISLDRKGMMPETVGKPISGVELKLGEPDENGQSSVWVRSKAVALHSVGPMSHLSAGSSSGEHGRTSESRPVRIGGFDADGFLRTGELGQIDRTHRLTLFGREDDLVKVEGKRVALGEVEGCLESFPKVKSAQAKLFADEHGSTMIVANVVVSGRCRAEDLIDHCAKNLAPYKVPRRIDVRFSLSSELGGPSCVR